ncbi:MAG: glycosyltransferase [Luteolibacter sp.]
MKMPRYPDMVKVLQADEDFGNSLIATFPTDKHDALILGRNNGVGLDQDAKLLSEALSHGRITTKQPKLRSLRALLSGKNRAEMAFHLERAAPWWKAKAKTHILIPNQERFPHRLLKRLKMIDHVFCKSRHAAGIFSRYHPSVHFIGFTSPDRHLETITPDYSRFFHLAGKSTLKNTEALLALWERHPEWPVLTLVQHPDNAPKSVPENVELISRYLSDDELRRLQNQCGIHLCPSLSEGWGHYIVEAMSCRAVTLITDAPPMNELVNAERGITVPFYRSEPRHLGENFHIDPQLLEKAIQDLITSATEEKARLGNAAREWFLNNDRTFPGRLHQALQRCRMV